MAEDKSGKKMIAVNREVRHEYFVIEALETGIELVGTEVKSIRAGTLNLKTPGPILTMASSLPREFTSAPMNRATFSIKTRAARGGCWRTRQRYAVWASKLSCKAIPWFRCRSTSKKGASSWS